MKTRKNNIVLIGMPGSGKTTTGRILSNKTGADFIDLDFLIEENAGMKISFIFEKYGETYFRELETANLTGLLAKESGFVLSTGAGAVENNIELLKRLGMVCYLEIPLKAILERIKDDKTRPLLQKPDPKKALEDIFLKRRKYYELADFRADAAQSPDEIANRILYEKTNR